MEKKQSSIDWLESKINAMIQNGGDTDLLAVIEHIQQAKAMHKEEVQDAWINGTRGQMIAPFGINRYKPDAEEYYNETFGGNNE